MNTALLRRSSVGLLALAALGCQADPNVSYLPGGSDGANGPGGGPGGGTGGTAGGVTAGGVTLTGGGLDGGAGTVGTGGTGNGPGTGGPMMCPVGQPAQPDGTCGCPVGTIVCNAGCFAGTECPTGDGCNGPGLVSNFEDLATTVLNVDQGWAGDWYQFGDPFATQTLTVEATGEAGCNGSALHAAGSTTDAAGGYVGIGVALSPAGPIDASAYDGIRIRARVGSPQTTPVRFNFQVPYSEVVDQGGACTAGDDVCRNHPGRFLYGLGTEYQEFELCFDSEFYPLFIPANGTFQERSSIGSSIIGLQFQFNKAKNITDNPPNSDVVYPEFLANIPYDFWLDEVEFITGACEDPVFQSTPGTTVPFGSNQAMGSCAPIPDAAAYNAEISRIYEFWKEAFLRDGGPGLRVARPEEGYDTVSEGMGYGMLIAAAMGERPVFDQLWQYTESRLQGNGLMSWQGFGQGSATDADADIAMALLMADNQWPGNGYGADADAMIGAIAGADVDGQGRLRLGSQFDGSFNASYFMPSYFRVFAQRQGGGPWTQVINNSYTTIANNQDQMNGLVSDWALFSGTPQTQNQVGAAVGSGGDTVVYGFDASRTPWRLGMDACFGAAQATTALGRLLGFLANQYPPNGGTINELVSDWSQQGTTTDNSVPNQIAFIGPVAVGAHGTGRTAMRDSAFRGMLDIMENPEFNQTYYPMSIGLINLLVMTGNFPHP